MITFLEDERRFLFSLINDQYQNWNYRSLEGDLLQSILSKLSAKIVSFTEQENRRCQWLMRDTAEVYVRIADPRLQHIIQGGSGRNSGVGAASCPEGLGATGGGATLFFDGPAMYNTCTAILAKLEGDMGL